MANPFRDLGVSDAEVEKAIRESVAVNLGIDEFVEKELIPFARSISPVDSGKYAASWKLKKKAKNGKAVAGPTVWYAHLIEFGTGADKKNKRHVNKKRPKEGRRNVPGPGDSRIIETGGEFLEVGPDTPTPAFGVAQKVAERFGGTYKGGIGTD
ncbi:HK97 gp10 family phage protein [Mycobacterium sp. SMC-13]|uniref:HK97 gp10 family phage protein n=1 Tax=Mycobacterium sp. SMC-13 TaxID=3381626 RepID=UPI0038768F57